MTHVIAIDGPSGVGKTTVARGVAAEISARHLDTGAFYRAATVVALLNDVDLRIEVDVTRVAAAVEFDYVDSALTANGVDLSTAIRSEVVTDAVSVVAAYPSVRRLLVARQRAWVEACDATAVVEGRDIGSVVFPDALVKVFLTADPTVRARRRAGEMTGASVERVAEDLARRDTIDSSRETSPLATAPGAVVIDTSHDGPDEVIGTVVALARANGVVG